MKGLKKIALASAVAAVSAGAQAELKALDDSAMGELTGQAGLTIDLETKYTIGEFMYKDAGSVFLTGIELQANENDAANGSVLTGGAGAAGFVDNIRIKLDIAGAGDADVINAVGDGTTAEVSTGPLATVDNELDTGFSRVRTLAALQGAAASGAGNADTGLFLAAAGGISTIGSVKASAGLEVDSSRDGEVLTLGDKKTYGDGDLLIHVSFKDAWQKIGPGGLGGQLAAGTFGDNSFEDVLTSGLKSVDFSFSIDAIGLAASDFEAGDSIGAADVQSYQADGTTDSEASTTVLISQLDIDGYLGPVDIHIENDGNGFTAANGDTGYGNADSVINWNTYINITDLDVYIDIAGVAIENLKINNVRGDVTDLDGNFAFGFAQSKREIYAVRNAAGLSSAKLAAAYGVVPFVAAADGTGGIAVAALGSGAAVADAYGVDGVAINTHFKGDMEIGALSFGDDGESIGQLYWTDIDSQTNWTISAH
ncbi:MAG: DUF6160 family protein [Oleiphilaceae bacterium]|nr:DUF6160 family protein [Oleiphilaceae bacterium]